MAERDHPARSGWASNSALQYLWRPRHRDEDPHRARRATIAAAAAVVLGIGTATYVGFRGGDDKRPPAGAAQPAPFVVPGDSPSASVSAAPTPSASPPSKPSAAATTHSARPRATPRATKTATTTHPPTAGTKTPAPGQTTITGTSVLTTGQSWSTNRLRLTVTNGGNLVLQDQGKITWQTGTTDGVELVMQNDGNLVLYNPSYITVWRSDTQGNPGAVLILRADGTMVISLNGHTLFQTGTGH